MQTLTCPNCNDHISASNINIEQAIAVCSSCDTVFDFSSITESKKKKRQKMYQPERFEVSEHDGELQLGWKWFSPMAFFLTFFVIFWDGFLVVWYSIALTQGELIMILFPLLHVAAGAGLTYYTLALYLNKSIITVNDAVVRVETKPMPFPGGNKTINAEDIEQVFVKQKITRGKNGSSVSYNVMVNLPGTGYKELVRNLEKSEFAMYIEQEIESYLGIENRPMPGEYGG